MRFTDVQLCFVIKQYYPSGRFYTQVIKEFAEELRDSYKEQPSLKFGKFEIRALSRVKFDAEYDGDIGFHWKPRKTAESDLSQNMIILKNKTIVG